MNMEKQERSCHEKSKGAVDRPTVRHKEALWKVELGV
jgi:hypothetical protein